MAGEKKDLWDIIPTGNVQEAERIILEENSRAWSPAPFCILVTGSYLSRATEYGYTEMVRRFLELGGVHYSVGICLADEEIDNESLKRANVFLCDDYYEALLQAAIRRDIESLVLLVEFRLFKVPKSKEIILEDYGEFVQAAKERDFQKIQSLLESAQDKDVYLKGWKGHNIMNLCLFLGCPSSCIQTMVDHGIGVNGWDYNGYTPLMSAILGENEECVKFLLDNGAEPYAVHLLRRMSFHDDGCVQVYDDLGETIHLSEEDKLSGFGFFDHKVGSTALMYAASMGNVVILKLMLKSAPNDIPCSTRIEIFNDHKPLHCAIEYSTVNSISLLFEQEDRQTILDGDPVYWAVRSDKIEALDFLLEKIVDLDLYWPCEAVLEMCVCRGRTTHLKKVLDSLNKMNKDVFSIKGGFAYFLTIGAGGEDDECFDLFAQQPNFRVDIKCKDKTLSAYGLTSFMQLCQQGNLEKAKLFFEMGANVNAKDPGSRTAAMFAARNDNVDCLKFLLDVHADFDVVDLAGGTVLSAALMGNGKALDFLLDTDKGVLLDGKKCLKHIHKESLKYFSLHRYNDGYGCFRKPIELANIQKLVAHGIFYWGWCTLVDKLTFHNFLFAAVTSNTSPGKCGYKGKYISPFVYAVLTQDIEAVRYMLATRYFSAEDYRFIVKQTGENYVKNWTNDEESDSDLLFLLDKITLRFLTLKTWSVMTISEVFSSSDNNDVLEKRNDQVETLPIPEALKDELKLKSENSMISQLCPCHWKRLGPQRGENSDAEFDDIRVNGEIEHDPYFIPCFKRTCMCSSIGLTLKGAEIHGDQVENLYSAYLGGGMVEMDDFNRYGVLGPVQVGPEMI